MQPESRREVSVQDYASARVSKDHEKQILSIDFSDDGSLLVTADQCMLNLYQAQSAKRIKSLAMKSKEIRIVRFTHHNSAVICATKKNHEIVYWSIHENEVVKVFRAHTDEIECLEMCPLDDCFLSTARDQTVRLWSLASKHPGPLACLDLHSKVTCSYPVAAFDNRGLIFVVAFSQIDEGSSLTRLRLYNRSKFESGSFISWTKDYGEVKLLKFSKCGKLILCQTSECTIAVLDAYDGKQKFKLTNIMNENLVVECSFSPDSNYIVAGSEDGKVTVWDMNGQKKKELLGHVEKCRCVKFSPSHHLLVSAGRNLIWWLPKIS